MTGIARLSAITQQAKGTSPAASSRARSLSLSVRACYVKKSEKVPPCSKKSESASADGPSTWPGVAGLDGMSSSARFCSPWTGEEAPPVENPVAWGASACAGEDAHSVANGLALNAGAPTRPNFSARGRGFPAKTTGTAQGDAPFPLLSISRRAGS